MRAVDTNVVVRYLLGGGDDRAQFARAVDIVESSASVFVTTTVLLETEWVLRSVYDFARADVLAAMTKFVGMPSIVVEDSSRLCSALAWMQAGFDFADALHLAGAKDCDEFVTFDRALTKIAGAAGAKPPVR